MDRAAADLALLEAAYRATRYCVTVGTRELCARIDARALEIEQLLAERGAASGTFITAWNPMSRQRPAGENRAANDAMAAALAARGVATLPHHGRGDDATWPPEQGFLALDLPIGDALELARAFDQHAIVVVARGMPAALHWTGRAPVR